MTEFRVGDEVRLEWPDQYPGVVFSGPVAQVGSHTRLGPIILARDGVSELPGGVIFTVTKPAPRPFYANYDRAEPVSGDVCRAALNASRMIYIKVGDTWSAVFGNKIINTLRAQMPDELMLLVDGDTGLPPREAPPAPAHDVLDMS